MPFSEKHHATRKMRELADSGRGSDSDSDAESHDSSQGIPLQPAMPDSSASDSDDSDSDDSDSDDSDESDSDDSDSDDADRDFADDDFGHAGDRRKRKLDERRMPQLGNKKKDGFEIVPAGQPGTCMVQKQFKKECVHL